MSRTAQKESRDLDPKELELAERARDRINVCNTNMIPLEESRKISIDSAERIAEIAKHMAAVDKEKPAEIEYRSAGQYVLDYWKGSLGATDAMQRLDTYNRAASHQTTADNPGPAPDADRGAGHQLHRHRAADHDVAWARGRSRRRRGRGRR